MRRPAHLGSAICFAALLAATARGTVLFGPDGLVQDRSKAVGELVAWRAPEASLALVDETVEHLGRGAYAVTRTIRNTGARPVAFKDELRVRDCFEATRYLIPCVSYNGNKFGEIDNVYQGRKLGAVKVPKGLSCNGEPWVFSYERTGVPACTLTENGSVGLAVFAANDTKESLVSACSLQRPAGAPYEHVIVRPVTEAPATYENKGVFGPRYDTYVTLGPGETFTARSHVCVCRPRWRNYAAADMMSHALRLLRPHLDPVMTDDEVYDLGTRYIRSLFVMERGKWLIATNRKQRMFADQHAVRITREEMAERMKWEYWTDIATFSCGFEIGWAGQNFLSARLLAAKALRMGDKPLLEKAIGVYDAFLGTQRPNGLLYTKYNHNFGDNAQAQFSVDTCNMGWGAAEAVRMMRLLRANGIDKPEYLEFAKRIMGFFIGHWSEECGFGKSWSIAGEPIATAGSIGGFLLPALMELHAETKDRRYLDCALRASDFYFRRDLDNFECTAGAIDCYCIDKETAYPFISGSLALYRATGDRKHLERAEKAAWYFTSWMFFFDTVCSPETDFAKYGYHTTGGTSVSIEHHVIDPWGGILVPELLELAELTGNVEYRTVAQLMWANAMQGITRRLGDFVHDMQRPIGSQNEAFFQARFNKYRPVVEAGYWNDLLVGWPSAYRVWTIERLREKGPRGTGK